MIHAREGPMTALRKPVNLSIDANLMTEAKSPNVNISRAAQDGRRAAFPQAWQIEYVAAIASSNEYVTKHGLPRAGKRPFYCRGLT